MPMFRWTIIPFLALLLVCSACKREASPGNTATPAGDAAEASSAGRTPAAQASAVPGDPVMPASVREFRQAFLPIYAYKPVEGRSKRACDAFAILQKKVNAMDGESPPTGVAADEWSSAVEAAGLCTGSIGEYCDDEDIGSEDMAAEHLECAHRALERITALAPGGSGDLDMTEKQPPDTAPPVASAAATRAALEAFEDAFLAAWKGDPDGRVARACKAGLFKLAARIDDDAAPPGVAADEWRDAVGTLWQETEEFGANCDGTDDAVEHLAKTLVDSIHESLQELRKLHPR